MGDLISREFLQTAIHNFFNGLNHTPTEEDIQRYIEVAPSADIMECARAIKDYCRNRDSLDEPCEGCPFHFYDGFAGFCVINYGLYPNEWYKTDKRDLPEGEKGGAE